MDLSVDTSVRSGVQFLLPTQIRIDPNDDDDGGGGGGGGGEVRRELLRALSSLRAQSSLLVLQGSPASIIMVPADIGGRVLVLDTIMRECGLTASDLQVSAFSSVVLLIKKLAIIHSI